MAKKKRIPIPDELAAEVMFTSDRTCCICRTEKQKVQVHHIDSDPSNNSLDNLAVICLHCHSDAHTSGAFVRGLTQELVTLYNKSWREIVKLQLLPKSEIPENTELAQEALLQASLDCHYWKGQFIRLLGGNPTSSSPGQFVDVWDAMAEFWVPSFDLETYKNYMPLFTSDIEIVRQRLDNLSAQYADVLPSSFRVLVLRGQRQLETEQFAYLLLPNLEEDFLDVDEHVNMFFCQRFVGVIRVLRDIARQANSIRENLASGEH